ncbi:GNAT family N-acetyltransferase [Streptomyces sp. NPDC003023]|uniref:GNAT family N-acetyltransferase n=1 Tax=Streptomyces sp. NPDC003023 TaxID=3364675 RepID=UPI003696886E
MPTQMLLARARGLWEDLARMPGAFGPQGAVNVVVSPQSGLCPPGWVGAVTLGGSALVTVGSESTAVIVRDALTTLPVGLVADAAAVRSVLPVTATLGPATLSYVSPAGFRPAAAPPAVDQLSSRHEGVRALQEWAGRDDAAEAALEEVTSPVFAIHEDGRVVAAAGYRAWPRRTAHLSVLTAPERRGCGLARATASAAVAHALAAGLLPQWRARTAASWRVAAASGFEELGAQLSLELGREKPPASPAPGGPAR